MVSPVFTASVDSLLLSVLSLPLSWLFPPPVFPALLSSASFPEEAAGVAVAEDVLFSLFPLWDDGAGVAVAEGVSSYPSVAISSPTSGLLPAIPKGLKECVLNTIVLPSTLGTMVSIAPLSRRCSMV